MTLSLASLEAAAAALECSKSPWKCPAPADPQHLICQEVFLFLFFIFSCTFLPFCSQWKAKDSKADAKHNTRLYQIINRSAKSQSSRDQLIPETFWKQMHWTIEQQ